jgi:hypothetical protein
MIHSEIIEAFDRRPFIPFELWLEGGFVVSVPSSDHGTVGNHVLVVRIWDDLGKELIVDTDKIVSIRLSERPSLPQAS